MFASEHIPGAISNPASSFDMSIFENIAKDATVVVYCVHGIASMQVADYMESIGYADVYSLAGGYKSWLK